MLLRECMLLFDCLSGQRTLRLNGQEYDVGVLAGAITFRGRHKKPQPTWIVRAGHCDCPARYFRGECKHEEAAKLLGTYDAIQLQSHSDQI